MIYTWRCTRCGDELDHDCPVPCPLCGARIVRVYGVRFNRRSANTEEVFNTSLGIPHRTDTQAVEHIKRLNDERGSHYVMADPDDTRML